jgi:uncharacterized protein (TIRG00374 family)
VEKLLGKSGREIMIQPAGQMQQEPAGLKPPKGGRAGWVRTLLGFAITGVFVFLVARQLSPAQVLDTLSTLNPAWLFVALLSLIAGYSLRIFRWHLMLRAQASDVSLFGCAGPFMISIAINNTMPLRAGDVVRIFAFRDRLGIQPSFVAGTLLVERILDLCILLCLFFLTLAWVPFAAVPQTLVTMAGWFTVAVVAALGVVFLIPIQVRRLIELIASSGPLRGNRVVAGVAGIAENILDSFIRLRSGGRAFLLLLLTILSWLFEGGVFVATMMATSIHQPPTVGLFTMTAATLSTMIPSSPGYVGTFHYFAIEALKAFGSDATVAAAFAVAVHLILWVSTTLVGAVFLAAGGFSRLRERAVRQSS